MNIRLTRPILVILLSVTFDQERVAGSAREPGYVLGYVYIDRRLPQFALLRLPPSLHDHLQKFYKFIDAVQGACNHAIPLHPLWLSVF